MAWNRMEWNAREENGRKVEDSNAPFLLSTMEKVFQQGDMY